MVGRLLLPILLLWGNRPWGVWRTECEAGPQSDSIE